MEPDPYLEFGPAQSFLDVDRGAVGVIGGCEGTERPIAHGLDEGPAVPAGGSDDLTHAIAGQSMRGGIAQNLIETRAVADIREHHRHGLLGSDFHDRASQPSSRI
jgi:hypothetical protein